MDVRPAHLAGTDVTQCVCRPAAPAAVAVQLLRTEAPLVCVLYSDASLAVWDAQRHKQLLHVPPVLEAAALQQAPLKLQVQAHDAQVGCLRPFSQLPFKGQEACVRSAAVLFGVLACTQGP